MSVLILDFLQGVALSCFYSAFRLEALSSSMVDITSFLAPKPGKGMQDL